MKHVKGGSNVDDHISWILPEPRGQCVFSVSTMLSVSFIRKPSTSHIVPNTSVPIQSVFLFLFLFLFSSSSVSVRLEEKTVIDQNDVSNLLIFLYKHSQSSYNQTKGHRENFITTTISASQYHIVSPLQIHDSD